VWRIDYFSLCGSFPFFSEQEIRTVAYSRTGSRHFYRKKFTLPSDEELWQEYKEEIDGSGYEGTDYIKSMGLEDNYENDDF
jgi:hypothetical protein